MNKLAFELGYKYAAGAMSALRPALTGAGMGVASGSMGENQPQDMMQGGVLGGMGGLALGGAQSLNPPPAMSPVKPATPPKIKMPRIR
jgi:hypothetical protein